MPQPAIRFTGPRGKFTWRMLATVLGGQGISIALGAMVARGLAVANDVSGADAYLYVGLGLAGLCLLTAGLMRTRLGLPLGWLCQALTLASGVVVGTMFIVGAIFLGLWVLCLVPGAKAEAIVAEREAAAA